jgi:hypothetical protein
MDSQCKYAAIARGDASIYLRLPTRADYRERIWVKISCCCFFCFCFLFKIFFCCAHFSLSLFYAENKQDHASGYLLVREAGGKVDDVLGSPLNFGLGRSLESNSGVIATNGLIHSQVLEVVKEVLSQKPTESAESVAATNGGESTPVQGSEHEQARALVAEQVHEVVHDQAADDHHGHSHSHDDDHHGHSHSHGHGHSHSEAEQSS